MMSEGNAKTIVRRFLRDGEYLLKELHLKNYPVLIIDKRHGAIGVGYGHVYGDSYHLSIIAVIEDYKNSILIENFGDLEIINKIIEFIERYPQFAGLLLRDLTENNIEKLKKHLKIVEAVDYVRNFIKEEMENNGFSFLIGSDISHETININNVIDVLNRKVKFYHLNTYVERLSSICSSKLAKEYKNILEEFIVKLFEKLFIDFQQKYPEFNIFIDDDLNIIELRKDIQDLPTIYLHVTPYVVLYILDDSSVKKAIVLEVYENWTWASFVDFYFKFL